MKQFKPEIQTLAEETIIIVQGHPAIARNVKIDPTSTDAKRICYNAHFLPHPKNKGVRNTGYDGGRYTLYLHPQPRGSPGTGGGGGLTLAPPPATGSHAKNHPDQPERQVDLGLVLVLLPQRGRRDLPPSRPNHPGDLLRCSRYPASCSR